MWPFSKSKEEYKVPEFKQIKFGAYLYQPQEDITPYEIALLTPIFATVVYKVNIEPYLETHNLKRHFVKE